MSDLIHLIDIDDAREWASEFTRLVQHRLIDPADEGLMLAWFANAIETGRRHHPAAVAEAAAAVAAALAEGGQ